MQNEVKEKMKNQHWYKCSFSSKKPVQNHISKGKISHLLDYFISFTGRFGNHGCETWKNSPLGLWTSEYNK